MLSRTSLLRLIAILTAVLLFVVAASGWLTYRAGLAAVEDKQLDDLAADARIVADLLTRVPGASTDAVSAVRERLEGEAAVRDLRYTIIDRDGAVLLDTRAAVKNMENHNDRPEVVAARGSGEGRSIRRSGTEDQWYLYAARTTEDSRDLVARVSRRQRLSFDFSRRMIGSLLGTLAVALLMMVTFAWVVHRRWVLPLRQLGETAGSLSGSTKLNAPPPTQSGPPEVRELVSHFGQLAGQSQAHADRLMQQRQDITSLIDSLPDPVIVTDAQHRVLLINPPAARFLQVTPQQCRGARLVSVLIEPSLLEMYEGVTGDGGRSGTPIVREIRVTRAAQKLTYQAVAARMPTGGVLLVLRDISQLVATVQMKTDFVANASHELRTPVAAIKLAFETLRAVCSEEPQQSERCLEIVGGHLHRLEDLLADLLDLSWVESAEVKPQITLIPIESVVGRLTSTMRPLAKQKQINLTVESPGDLQLHSDRRLLDLVIKNLVENAIKYTPAGGTVTVRIDAGEAGDDAPHEDAPREDGGDEDKPTADHPPRSVSVVVIDTGIGIPPQHQERVFERFYQVDAARSGSSGRGTGLGLAIVKHAVHAMGGQVQLESTAGRGTTVTCHLPDRPGEAKTLPV